MVKITNGQEVILVTSGAYKEVFKRAGYRLLDEVQAEQTAEEVLQEVLQEVAKPRQEPMKPVSQWARKELLAYASEHGIEFSGKTGELRQAIVEHMVNL